MAPEFQINESREELISPQDVSHVENQENRRHRLVEVVSRHATALADSEGLLRGLGPGFENVLKPLLNIAVPSFSDWCCVDFADDKGKLRRVAIRHLGHEHSNREGESEECCFPSLRARVPEVAEITERVCASGITEVWPQFHVSSVPWCVVVALRVSNLPFGAITFVTDESHPGFGPFEIGAAEEIAANTSKALERMQLRREARESVRRTQHIASQLHQLISASFRVNALTNEHDIATSLAASAQSVFGADSAMVSLEADRATPMRVIVQKGKNAASVNADDESKFGDLPRYRIGMTVPWTENGWLVAPVLERRDRTRGVVAIRRESGPEFGAEDVEVLTLLAQTASTALGAAEMSRTIQNSEARWRVLVETAPVGIVEIDAASRVRWWNRAASKIFAWPEHTGDREIFEPQFPEAAGQQLRSLWSDVLNGAAAVGRDFLDVEIGARRRDLTASAVLLPSSDDGSRGILTLVDDVTEQRQMATENRHAHRMEIRGQVASNLAHDFNNLLTLISGYAEILSQSLASDDRSLQMITDIQATAARASGLTGQLLAIGRTKPAEPVVVDPVAAIESIAEVLERILGVDIELVWSLVPRSGNIYVDADQFEQMMLNLALNARDAMAAGGQLSMSVDKVAIRARETVDFNLPEGKYVQIKVADTGHGMDEETRRRCFEPMFTTKGPFKGSGLGLSAARRLVEESGGMIRCTSEVENGTTFEIVLPAIAQAAVQVVPSKSPDRPRGSSTVLLAEDDEDLRRFIGQVLRRNGYQVLEANTGERAIEVTRRYDGTIDLLLSDVVMPMLSGRDVALTLQEANPDLRVLLISGSADVGVLDGLRPGTAAFLSKPFRPSELIDQIMRLLAR
jgi:PAS domain S-box-containing protein